MRKNIIQLLAQKGQEPVIACIDKSVQDFKRMQYERGEIKETIREIFWGIDNKIDSYILSIGY